MAYPGGPLDGENSYRVLHLEPGQAGSVIYFQLESIVPSTNTSTQAYEAVSYTWGDANLQHEIFCRDNSAGDPAPLRVTASCHAALQNLRFADRPRILWIDAICINQSNIDERNAQVKIMGRIFAGASQVVVYLGEDADDSDLVMEWYKNEYNVSDYPRKDIAVSKPSLDARFAFAERAWFTRTWILQEVANAQRVLIKCGARTLPWEAYDFGDVFWTCNVQNVLRLVKRIRTLVDEPPESILLDVLKATRSCISSDPRDKVYGILPLIPQHLIPSCLRPDYNVSPQELFVRVASYLYPWLGPSMLDYVSENQMDLLPSWVPDWSSMQDGSRKLSPRNAGGKPPDGRHAPIPGTVRNGRLHIESVHIGSISKISSRSTIYETGMGVVMMEWLSMADALRKDPLDCGRASSDLDSNSMTDFKKVITQDKYPTYGRFIKEVIISWCIRPRNKYPEFSFHSGHHEVSRQIVRGCIGRRFAILGSHTLALVPAAARLDDVVHVLAGTSVPYLLRKKGDVYTIVGECYVQGIMDGEAVDGVDLPAMEKVTIV
ncbi:heterokaryon incompatibility protein [Stagonosporopsis vannaccii]|nr:heterokaryon incompatibility protein [Stagonosporopsis vannaccii]